jgi:acetylornithine deacetylase/succinyl-diaminopimelate desuccinylase-like protein
MRGPMLTFLGHLDVVEAKPEDWSVDPFKLTHKNGERRFFEERRPTSPAR